MELNSVQVGRAIGTGLGTLLLGNKTINVCITATTSLKWMSVYFKFSVGQIWDHFIKLNVFEFFLLFLLPRYFKEIKT